MMQSRLNRWTAGMALLMFSTVGMAAPPQDVTCAVLLPSAINAGQPYTVKVVRVPGYPGSWFSPTVNVDVVYPTTAGNVIEDSRSQTIKRFNVSYALATFTVPEMFDADSGEALMVAGGSAEVTATVLEPVNKKKFRETTCTGSVIVY